VLHLRASDGNHLWSRRFASEPSVTYNATDYTGISAPGILAGILGGRSFCVLRHDLYGLYMEIMSWAAEKAWFVLALGHGASRTLPSRLLAHVSFCP
jgi:hypothetical protein